MRRIGHKGAALIAPGNTFASFDAAAAAGVDMIEFDVLPEPDTGRLVLAHDYADAASRAPHTLEEGLTYLARESFEGIDLDVDLKGRGYELVVLDALRSHDLLGRSLITSQYPESLALIRAGDLEDPLRIAEQLLNDEHDLMHKVVGWMLREVGKQSPKALTGFLNLHGDHMPRMALRYAIERMQPEERKRYLAMGKKKLRK